MKITGKISTITVLREWLQGILSGEPIDGKYGKEYNTTFGQAFVDRIKKVLNENK